MQLDYEDIAREIAAAYEEGWGDYDSPANAMSTFEESWKNSIAKRVYDELMEKHNAQVQGL